MTDAMRIQLKDQGTQVLGVYAGFIDTDMTSGVDGVKTSPQQVASRTLDGIITGKDHVLADERAEEIWRATRKDPAGLADRMQQLWREGAPWAKSSSIAQ